MLKIAETECKVIKIERNCLILPAYELACPFCKQKVVLEVDLVKHVANVYCVFCGQVLEKGIFEKK